MPPKYISPNEQTVTRSCRHCDSTFTTRLSLAKRGEGFFCSRECKIGFQRAKAAADLADRFWSKVDCSGGPDACWPWQASCFDSGYGQFKIGRRNRRAHQVAWELTIGPVPEGKILCHDCDNPPCCNPTHLFPGTNADNSKDMVQKGRWGGNDGSNLGKGSAHARARLTETVVAEIRARYASGDTLSRLARRYGVTKQCIKSVVTRETWKHVVP